MAAITLQRLKQVISDAYVAGYGSSLELKDCYVDELIASLLDAPDSAPSANDGWKIYKVRELRELKPGTILEHFTRGKGWIETQGVEKWLKFENGEVSHFFQDASPWDEPMRVLGMTMKGPERQPPARQRRFGQLNDPFAAN